MYVCLRWLDKFRFHQNSKNMFVHLSIWKKDKIKFIWNFDDFVSVLFTWSVFPLNCKIFKPIYTWVVMWFCTNLNTWLKTEINCFLFTIKALFVNTIFNFLAMSQMQLWKCMFKYKCSMYVMMTYYSRKKMVDDLFNKLLLQFN